MRPALLSFLALSLFALTFAAGPAAAQQSWRVITVPQPDGGEGGPESDLRRLNRAGMLQELAGALGAIHYFTVLCEGRSNQYWRERMIALVEAETPEGGRTRAAMIGAFNDQYREREQAFGACSPEARNARAATAERGQILSEALGEPYR